MMSNQELKYAALDAANRIRLADLKEDPYKYMVVDNAIFPRLIAKCDKEFPNDLEYSLIPGVESKSRSNYSSEFDFPDSLGAAVRILNSSMVMRAISDKFDIQKIVPDSYFTGGGLNSMLPSDFLDMHIDGNYHDATGLNRRLNAILFLNDDCGGHFLVDDKERIEPKAGRLVIFDTHDKSLHGVDATTITDERKSLILYYYTKEKRPKNQITVDEPHSALWKSTGFTDKNGDVTREYS